MPSIPHQASIPQLSSIPKAEFAIIGGSSTFSIRFPEDLEYPGVEVLEPKLVFDTPYGESPPFKLFRMREKLVLTCKFHGRRPGVKPADASRQVFWVFREAGVRRILAEGGVGAINHLLELRDFVVPTDYIDLSLRKDVELGGPWLLVMRQAICPDLHGVLVKASSRVRRTFRRGIYAVTDGRHFESPAEIQMIRSFHADIVGQTLCPEVYLAREIGACFAGVYMVVNYAEGIIQDWSHQDLKDIFYDEAGTVGRILLDSLDGIDVVQKCGCPDLRKPTLLRDKEYGDGWARFEGGPEQP